jgi:hypothetical protein
MDAVKVCTLKRCQGKRGCLCPQGNIPVGSYAGKRLDPLPVATMGTAEVKAVGNAKSKQTSVDAPKKSPVKKLDPIKIGTTKPKTEVQKVVQPTFSEESAPSATTTETAEVEGVDGEVMIRYSHYKKKFAVKKGSTTNEQIDAEYFLSFAFPKSKIHVTLYGPSDFSFEEKGFSSRPWVKENPEGTYIGLDPATEYWVDIEEDPEEKLSYEKRQDELAAASAAKRAQQDFLGEDDSNVVVITKTESCSCIEGNPCLDRYACRNWEQRYEIAKKNGWKGFQ